VADEDVTMETDINDFNGKMKVIKSENNKVFYDYIMFLRSMKNKAMSLQGENNEKKRNTLDLEVKNYQKNNIINNKK
jgi:hypothetical protein